MSQALIGSTTNVMEYEAPASPSRAAVWAGRAISALPVLFLLMDCGMKFARPAVVVEGTRDLGYPEWAIVPLGYVLLACTVLYVVPRTAAVGAILLTAYLGGAVSAHVRLGHPMLSHTLFPTYLAVMLWAGLVLRDRRLRAVLPWRS